METSYNDKLGEIYEKLKSSENGLSSEEANKRFKLYGANVYKTSKRKDIFNTLINQFKNPLTILLLIVVFVSLITGDQLNSIIILVMVGFNTILGFTQEYKALNSLEKLKKLIKHNVKIIRDEKIINIDSSQLVIGDILILNKGNVLPADARIISCTNLFVNESTLTGESIDVEKNANDHKVNSQLPQHIKNYVFQGSSITEGIAKAIVTSTGKDTILGKSVYEIDKDITESNYVRNIKKFSKILFYFVLFITVAVLIINVSLGRGILQSLILGISLALGITPETMPIIISIALSSAAFKLSKQNVLIKRISSFEDLGNVDTICTDKTGTITKGILEIEGSFNLNGERSNQAIELASICNSANPKINGAIIENTIDTNIWNYSKKNKLLTKINNYKIVKTWDFDFRTRNIAVLTTNELENKFTLIVKGASEELIKLTEHTKEEHEKHKSIVAEYEIKGNKVIAVATKEFIEKNETPKNRNDFKDLKLVGFILLKDQPRENLISEFDHLENLNIKLKILTGDSGEVTKQICQKAELDIIDTKIITGDELEQALSKSQDSFDSIVNHYNIFARVDPEQKLKIIQSLKNQKHVVAYLGDGINDVGALKVADVGIAVNTASDVAKDSADIIILDSKLSTVATGVKEGRKVFANTMKFIFSTMSSSFGNVITIVFASIFLKFIPLLPAQIILLDSLSDFQHLAISTDKVDKKMINKPRNWDFKIFIRYIIYWGVISTIFDFGHIIIINTLTTSPEIFRTTWLIESLITEILATIALRTHGPFYKSKPSRLMILFSSLPILLAALIIYLPESSKLFGLQSPPLYMFGVIFIIITIYLAVIEFSKRNYFKQFWGIGK